LIGGAGGAIAGLTIWLIQYAYDKVVEEIECNRVYRCLKENTTDKAGEEFKSTWAIASWNSLTEDRVRYVCSVDKRIFLSTGEEKDMWSIHGRTPRSSYENNQEVLTF